MRWLFLVLILFSCNSEDEEMRLFISNLNTDGGSTPTNPYPTNRYDYMMIPLYGQSLSLNTGSAPTITGSTSYTYKMSDGLTETSDGTSTIIPYTNAQNDAQLVMLETIIRHRPAEDVTKLLGCTSGVGGSSIANLSRGLPAYNKMMSQITAAHRVATSEGKTLIVPAIAWQQGEEDLKSVDNFYYQNSLNTLVSQLNEDIKALTNQEENIYLVMGQQGTHADYGRYPRIALQHLSGANDNPLLYFGKSMYDADFVSDEVHGTTQTYQLMGVKYGWQIMNDIIWGKYTTSWVNPINHTYSNLKSTITFNVPYPPLVLDSVGDVTPQADGNYGFKLFDVFEDTSSIAGNTIAEPVATITDVQLNGNTIEITYSADPTGSRLTYAINGNGWQQVTGVRDLGDTGRVQGARGQLRDSQGNTLQLRIDNGAGVQQFYEIHNWCPIFEIQL